MSYNKMKKIKYTSVLIVIAIFSGCQETIPNNQKIYPQVPLQKWVNEYQAESQEPNYSDNKIYNDCLELSYKYHYEKDGETKYFKQERFGGDWEFITLEELNKGIGIKTIKISAKNPNPNYNNPSQSAVEYEVLNSKNESLGTESTGVVENHKNIVMHNTRSGFFKPLFSFPWPSIKFPIKENQNWNWEFSYSSQLYGDDRLFNWEGATLMKYVYSYIGEEILRLDFGHVQTSKYRATGTNDTIHNKLTYYFNSKLGFVKQQFETHDGAFIELEAIEYKNRYK